MTPSPAGQAAGRSPVDSTHRPKSVVTPTSLHLVVCAAIVERPVCSVIGLTFTGTRGGLVAPTTV